MTSIIVKHVKFLQLEISLLINQNFIIMDPFIGQIMMFAGTFCASKLGFMQWANFTNIGVFCSILYSRNYLRWRWKNHLCSARFKR